MSSQRTEGGAICPAPPQQLADGIVGTRERAQGLTVEESRGRCGRRDGIRRGAMLGLWDELGVDMQMTLRLGCALSP